MTATKAIPGEQRLRKLYQRIREGVNWVLPQPVARPEAERPDQAQQRKVRALVDKYKSQFDQRATELGEQFAEGTLTPREFRAQMLTEIRYMRLTAAAAAAGGIGSLDADDLARVDAGVREQAAYLDRWMAQAERTPVEERSGKQMAHRARMYGGNAVGLAMETIDKKRFKGWPDMPFQPADRTKCKGSCACGWEWRIIDEAAGNADVFWRVDYTRDVDEHCPTCVNRLRDFAPLRIRNFHFENMPTDLSPYLD